MAESTESTWTEVATSASSTLYAAVSSGSGSFAVGTGGILLARRAGAWGVADEDGPGDAGNSLYAAASTDDGERIWVGGASGALGYYDVEADETVDHSAPEGMTGSWRAITVTGTAGSEKVLVANGSGEALSGTVDGASGRRVDWVEAARSPDSDALGDGASVHTLEAGPDAPYASNSSGGLFRAVDGQWECVGIAPAESTLYDVYVDDSVAVAVGANGFVYWRTDASWEQVDVADEPLYGVDRDAEGLVAVGGSGRLFRRAEPDEWNRVETPTDEPLRDLELASEPGLAIGGNGTILERPTPEKQSKRESTSTAETQ